MRSNTSGRWSASVVVDPVDEFCRLDLLANEIRGDEREAFAFINRDRRTIDAGAEAEANEFRGPKFQVVEVGAGKTATLLYVQKDDGTARKTLAVCSSRSSPRIFSDSLQGIGLIAQLTGSRSSEEQGKTKSVRAKKFAFAGPGNGFFTGRRAKPVAREGKGFAKNRQRGIARIVVPIEAEIGLRGGSLRARSGNREQKTEEKECC